jgi:hypothetical protein
MWTDFSSSELLLMNCNPSPGSTEQADFAEKRRSCFGSLDNRRRHSVASSHGCAAPAAFSVISSIIAATPISSRF